MKQAYIALGTNLGNKTENLNRAVNALSLLPGTKILAVSDIYRTAPVGYANQDDFYNAVVRISTELSPGALLGACLGIEAAMGRLRTRKNGPRVLDLDLLLYEEFESNTPELTVPHPRMLERAFVLTPLCDICHDRVYKDALRALPPARVQRVPDRLLF